MNALKNYNMGTIYQETTLQNYKMDGWRNDNESFTRVNAMNAEGENYYTNPGDTAEDELHSGFYIPENAKVRNVTTYGDDLYHKTYTLPEDTLLEKGVYYNRVIENDTARMEPMSEEEANVLDDERIAEVMRDYELTRSEEMHDILDVIDQLENIAMTKFTGSGEAFSNFFVRLGDLRSSMLKYWKDYR